MREMEAILKVVWAANPVLLASLKSACHVERPPKKKKTDAAMANVLSVAAVEEGEPMMVVSGNGVAEAPDLEVAVA